MSRLWLLLFLGSWSLAQAADPRAELLRQHAATRGFMLGRPVGAIPSPDGKTVLFLRSPPRSPELALFELDLGTGDTRALLTPAELLKGADEQLAPAERARRERTRTSLRGFTSFQLSEDGQLVLVPFSGQLYSYRRDTGVTTLLPTGKGPLLDPQLSPDGKRVAYVRERDLYLLELGVKAAKERRLTTSGDARVSNGLAEFVAQEEMDRMSGFWWSPDGNAIAFEEADTRPVETFHLIDVAHPESDAEATPYPRAGGENARVRLALLSLANPGRKPLFVDWDRERYPYLARVVWKDGPLTLVVERRDQKELALLVADAKTGRTRRLLVEEDDTWLNLDSSLPRWVKQGQAFLWSSERSGASALELRDAEGALVRALSGAADGYVAVAGVDAQAVWFHGAPEPEEQHLYRVALDGDAAAERRTREPGVYSASFNPSGTAYVLKAATLTSMPRFFGRGPGARGELERELPSVAESPPPSTAPAPVLERVGAAGLRALVVRPRDFRAGRRYPVVLDVYGGPHHQQVTRQLAPLVLRQWYADHGFLVVAVDGRGTPRRGRVWERALKGNFAGVPLDDQVDALRALGARHPEMDLSRVGVMGWSFGGYLAALAVLRRPDVFAVGIAGAPVVDWRDYDTFYTERYLGLPETNPESYRQSSLLTYAAELARPLLVIHGTRDDNVYFFHSLKLCEALFRAQKSFNLLPLPGLTHMVPDPAVREALHNRILLQLVSVLKP